MRKDDMLKDLTEHGKKIAEIWEILGDTVAALENIQQQLSKLTDALEDTGFNLSRECDEKIKALEERVESALASAKSTGRGT